MLTASSSSWLWGECLFNQERHPVVLDGVCCFLGLRLFDARDGRDARLHEHLLRTDSHAVERTVYEVDGDGEKGERQDVG